MPAAGRGRAACIRCSSTTWRAAPAQSRRVRHHVFPSATPEPASSSAEQSMSGAESDKMLADSIKAAGNVLPAGRRLLRTPTPGVSIPDFGISASRSASTNGGAFSRRFRCLPTPRSAWGTTSSCSILMARSGIPFRFVRIGQRRAAFARTAAAMRVRAFGRPMCISTARCCGWAIARCRCRGAVCSTENRRRTVILWGLINFRGPALLDDLSAAPIRPTRSFDLAVLGAAAPRERQSRTSIRRSSATRSCSSARRRPAFRRVRDAVRAVKMPGIQVHAAVADDFLSNRFMRPESRARHDRASCC